MLDGEMSDESVKNNLLVNDGNARVPSQEFLPTSVSSKEPLACVKSLRLMGHAAQCARVLRDGASVQAR